MNVFNRSKTKFITNDYIEIYDNIITGDNCDSLIDKFESSKDIQVSGKVSDCDTSSKILSRVKESTEITINTKLLKDPQWNSTLEPLFNGLYKSLKKYRKKYTRMIKNNIAGIDGIDMWQLSEGINFQKFEPTQGYKVWHCENANEFTCNRVLTWMVYLNDVPDGGTDFLNQGVTLDARLGRCVIWPPYWTHFHKSQVSPTTTKYLITGWMSFSKKHSG